MTTTQKEETTPDQLMDVFRGPSLKSIIIFTVVAHVIVLLGSSTPYLLKTMAGGDTSKQSEEERLQIAVREATSSLRQIAEAHGLKPQDLSSQFSDGKPKAAKAPAVPEETSAADKPAEPEKPKSTIEKEIEKVAPAPSLPSAEDEDLFK